MRFYPSVNKLWDDVTLHQFRLFATQRTYNHFVTLATNILYFYELVVVIVHISIKDPLA